MDDVIILSKSKVTLDIIVKSLFDGKENFDLTDEGTLDQHLGIEIRDKSKGSYEMVQPFLIERIIKYVRLDDKQTQKRTTPVGKPVLFKDLKCLPRKRSYNYRAAVGMLNYLQGVTRPDISMAVHQCARFCNDPKLSHERAIQRIARCLLDSKDKGLLCKVDHDKGIELYVNADFAGGWNSEDSYNADNLLSRTGYVMCYAGIPLF